MKSQATFRTLLASASLLTIAACAPAPDEVLRMSDVSDQAYAHAEASLNSARNVETVRPGGAQVSDGVFVAPVTEKDTASSLLPTELQAPDAVILASRDEMTIEQVATRLTEVSGVEHIVVLGPPGDMDEPSRVAGRLVRPDYSGTLSEVLNEVAAHYGVEWGFSDGKVMLREYVTRQYQVPVIPSIASGGSSVGQSSSSYNADFWGEFEASVSGIMGDDVVYNIGRSTGLMTVTARVDDHAQVKEFVEEISKNMAQQIAFDVNVISVTLDRSAGRGLDVGLAVSEIGGNPDASIFANAAGGLSQATSGMNLSIIDGSVSFDAVLSALSTQGKVSVDTRTGVTTVNNRPVPVEVVDNISYIASIETEQDDDGNSTVRPTPATQSVGFSLQLYPRIMNSSEIMVEYAMQLSEMKALKTYGEGENQIQLPEVSNTNFSQQAVLQNGQTLILSGFERTRSTYDSRKGGSLGGVLGVGGAQQAEEERVATVVMIRPRILANQRTVGNGQR